MSTLPKDESVDSLASLEEKINSEFDGDLQDMEFPTNIEEVEVEGERDDPQDEWMDVIGSGDLKKKVLVAGIVESRPVKGDTVSCQITIKLPDDTIVEEKHSITFTLGDCEVLKGLDLVVSLMDKGEESEVYMADRFGYGSTGDGDKVPPNSALHCTVALLDYKPEETPSMLSVADRQIVGNRKRLRGNWWFNRGDYSEAVQCYKAAVDFLDDTEEMSFEDETTPELMELLHERLKAFNNMAAAQIKLGFYDAAQASVKVVLDCQPNNVKALFRRAKVLQHQSKYSEAYDNLRLALSLEPENRSVHTELVKVTAKMKEESESEKSLYRRMLGVKKTEAKKHPTVELLPWKVFVSSFLVIVTSLLIFKYMDFFTSLLS